MSTNIAAKFQQYGLSRHGLVGLPVEHVPTGARFTIGNTRWDRDGKLLLDLGTVIVPAADCVFTIGDEDVERQWYQNLPALLRKGRKRPR